MIKDRGKIKWTAMMLPEHVEKLKQLSLEDQKVQRPILDEQQLELMNDLIQESLSNRTVLRFVYLVGGMKKTIDGNVLAIDFTQKKIVLNGSNGRFRLPMEDLCTIEPLD